ncbi:ead/Ea22-like family protein [Escherichia coli]|uniref:ead/Ea22-like family protein n=1 Tax=Escherichia coli TaxID=562 RepID=UPI003D3663D1
MKLMSLIEMDGFLKGKCIPRDLKVNETNAEYLVRKFAEAEAKYAALAAENAGIKSAIPESRDIEDDNDNMDDVSLAEDFGFNHAIERMRRQIPETPTTDAFLAEVRAQGVEMYADNLDNGADDAERGGFDDAVKFLRSEASGVRLFADQLRKGGNQ